MSPLPENRKRVASSMHFQDQSAIDTTTGGVACLPTQEACEPADDPFTDQFFQAMKIKIEEVFPVEDFAQEQSCNSSDVRAALSALVLAPLGAPQFWQGTKSVSAFGKGVIALWRTGRNQIEDQPMHEAGHAENPIHIVDSTCSTPVLGPEMTERSTISAIELDRARAQTVLVTPGTTHMPLEGDYYGAGNPQSTREIPTARVPVRLDVYGSYIPVDKWIEGHHKPPIRFSDEMSDEDLTALVLGGYFDKDLEN